jgi:SAM-dependent methyltransferase
MQKIEYTKMFDLEDNHFWFIGKRYFIDSVLTKYSKKIKNILDLGSGTGGLTHFLEKYGVVTGVEGFPYAVRLAKSRGLNIKLGDIQKIKLQNANFDLVTIFDVLYHQNVQDESLVLKNAYDHLKNGGYLLITDSALPILKSTHDVVTHGSRRYSLSTMVKLVEKNKFKVIKASYVYFSIFPMVFFKRVMLGKIIKEKGSDVKEISSTINKLLLKILKLEANFLKIISFPIGSSIIILASKDGKYAKNYK